MLLKIRTVLPMLALILGFGQVKAMDLLIQGNQVFASGPLGEDIQKFEAALAKPEVDTFVFLNSPGGDLWTGLRVGRMLAERKIKTVIGGRCNSACALMFLGGTERTFADIAPGTATSIGIHGAHNKHTGAIDPEVQGKIFAFMKLRIGENFNAAIMNQALYDMEDRSAMLQVFDKKRAPNAKALHCRSAQSPLDKCTVYPDATAMTLGLVTSDVTTHVELPDSLKKPDQLMGIALTQKIEDFGGYVSALAPKHCDSERCKELLLAHPTKGKHKAIAFPVTGFGFANNWDAQNEFSAVAAATYSCNHRKTRPVSLCQVFALDEFDLAPWHQSVAQSHQEALQRLEIPAQTQFADEATGGEFVRFNGIRAKYLFEMTPNTLAGIKNYTTSEIAMGLKTPSQSPVLIDVDVMDKTIPTAVSLLSAGMAYEGSEDVALEARYKALIQLLVPDMERPIVFFARSKETWTAANAALRALKIGYKNVGWYRGGMKAWDAAGLPVATPILKAVVN